MRIKLFIHALSAVLAFGYVCGINLASADAFFLPNSVEEMRADSVSKNTYVIHGLPGLPTPRNRAMIANLGFVETSDGVVVIDSGGSSEHAKILLKSIKAITSQPVVAVFNTHIHGDHWLGNDAIAKAFPNAIIYGHKNMLGQARDGAGDTWIDLIHQLTEGQFAPTMVHAPSTVGQDGDTYTFGNTQVRIIHTGKAHTDNDLMIHVFDSQELNVLFLGDNSFHERIGRMDDGHFNGNIQALNKAIEIDATVYVPGHGPTTIGAKSATSYRDFLHLLYTKTTELFEEGLADYEIKEAIIDDFSRWNTWSGFEESFGRLVSLVYLEVEESSF